MLIISSTYKGPMAKKSMSSSFICYNLTIAATEMLLTRVSISLAVQSNHNAPFGNPTTAIFKRDD
jgi:hypothetical protein